MVDKASTGNRKSAEKVCRRLADMANFGVSDSPNWLAACSRYFAVARLSYCRLGCHLGCRYPYGVAHSRRQYDGVVTGG